MGRRKAQKEVISPEMKRELWSAGIGLNKGNELDPSVFLYEVMEKNVAGELSNQEVENMLIDYYRPRDSKDVKIKMEKECDFTTFRVVELLENKNFEFSIDYLKEINRQLCQDFETTAGEFRNHQVFRKESVLNGETVKYLNFFDIEQSLEFEFKDEAEFRYSKLTQDEIIEHIARFTSKIWAIQPFSQANTRTIAIFIEKYLNTMGFEINNDLFKKYGVYFRNSLVRSNYSIAPKGMEPTLQYLIEFFENALLGKSNELDNRLLFVNLLFKGA